MGYNIFHESLRVGADFAAAKIRADPEAKK